MSALANAIQDGGGIRGYASLLMLKALMLKIGQIELSYNDKAHTSSYQPCERPKSEILKTRVTDLDESSLVEYLPCHYFGNSLSHPDYSVLIDDRLYCWNKYRGVSHWKRLHRHLELTVPKTYRNDAVSVADVSQRMHNAIPERWKPDIWCQVAPKCLGISATKAQQKAIDTGHRIPYGQQDSENSWRTCRSQISEVSGTSRSVSHVSRTVTKGLR
jgi:hypothetical protein